MTNLLHWKEAKQAHSAQWRTENASPMPRRVVAADDRLNADVAFRQICEGTALLWRGDFNNARQLLQALTRRIERKAKPLIYPDMLSAFHGKRQIQVQKVRILSMLLIPVNADYQIPLRRAPQIADAFEQVYGKASSQGIDFVIPLREILGIIGAYEWRKKGIFIAALDAAIHPHYGVFAPTRNEYIDLLAKTALPPKIKCAFDIGTGSGVLAAVLARRGIPKLIATDQDPRALACAAENLQHLGLSDKVQLLNADLFPPGQADLIICNPPWLPARPSSPLEAAIYDPDSRMLRGFLAGVVTHLNTNGQAWLILSDLAEHLGLRSRTDLLAWINEAQLKVLARHDIRPRHQRAQDNQDPLYTARSAEICSLWVLSK
jgi:methylase of polypeptide subunit release factors